MKSIPDYIIDHLQVNYSLEVGIKGEGKNAYAYVQSPWVFATSGINISDGVLELGDKTKISLGASGDGISGTAYFS